MSNWSELRRIVEDGAAVDAAARAAWLDDQCGDDAELRREAEELITASLKDEAYLQPPRLPGSDPILEPETRVGAYRLVRPLASGGMGTVYEAERKDPHRRVALKIMRTGLSSPASEARFRFEVEVLASLQHPSIAQMYETGVHVEQSNGRRELPWFAMEYVESAASITEWARGRDIRERVDLLAEVCDAVHHGHVNGVLHRDLKPDNILVDRAGRPKVIDFGVARATDCDVAATTMRTSAGEIVGTLAYMSPEQLAGRRQALDTRSDVYSLGVVLFQILTGELPYSLDGCDLMEIVQRVHSTVPRCPPTLPAELRTIVLKCLAKEPERRYDSAAALASDLRHYLAHEPIEAHPPSLTYQLRLFARRNRLMVASALLVFLVSVSAAVVSLVFLGQARRAEAEAVRRSNDVRSLFEALLQRSVDTTVTFAPRVSRLPGGAALTIRMIEATIRDLRVLQEQAQGDAEVLRQIAEAYLHLGQVQGDYTAPNQLGDRAAARRSYAHALEISSRLNAAHPDDDEIVLVHVEALVRVAKLESAVREFGEAGPRFEQALALARELYARRPDSVNYMALLIRTESRASEHYHRTGEGERAWRHQDRHLALALEAYERWPTQCRLTLVAAQHAHAQRKLVAGDAEAGRRHYLAARPVIEELVASEPENVRYRLERAYNFLHLGGCEYNLGNWAAAIEQIEIARGIYEGLTADDPANLAIPKKLGLTHAQLGHTYYEQSRADGLDAAARREFLRQATDSFERSWQTFAELEQRGKSPSGHSFAEMMRGQYEQARAKLDGD